MKLKTVLNVTTLIGLAISSSIAFSDVNTLSTTTEPSGLTLQTINELIQSGAVQENENGELVIQKSIVETLQDQGRLDQIDALPHTICD